MKFLSDNIFPICLAAGLLFAIMRIKQSVDTVNESVRELARVCGYDIVEDAGPAPATAPAVPAPAVPLADAPADPLADAPADPPADAPAVPLTDAQYVKKCKM